MARLWLMRHAPTADNAAGVVMGAADPEALPDGLAEAAEVGRTLAGLTFTRVISSPQLRAVATARALFPDADLAVDGRLRERDLGDWQGLAKEAIPAQALTPTRSIDLRAVVPGGEAPGP